MYSQSLTKISIDYIAVSNEMYHSKQLDHFQKIILQDSSSNNSQNQQNKPSPLNKYRFLCGTNVSSSKEEFNDSAEKEDRDYTLIYLPLLHDSKLNTTNNTIQIEDEYTIKAPEEMDPKLSVCMLMASLRIYTALFMKGKCLKSEKVLVINSADGYGYLACQLAHSIGCEVFAEVKNVDEYNFMQDFCFSLEGGTTTVIQSQNENFVDRIKESTINLGVDCVIDFSQNHNSNLKKQIIECLAPGGRWVAIDPELQLDPPESTSLFFKNASLAFCFEEAYELYGAEFGKAKTMMTDALEKFRSGKLKVFTSKEYKSIAQFEESSKEPIKFGSAVIDLAQK